MNVRLDKNGKKYYEARVSSIDELTMYEIDYLVTTPPKDYPKPYVLFVDDKIFYDSTKAHGIEIA